MANEITEVFARRGEYNPTSNPQGVTYQTILEYMNDHHPEQEVYLKGAPVGLGLMIGLPTTITEERFILEPIGGSGETETESGFTKQVTIYMWEGQLLNENSQPAGNNHISAPISFIAAPPLTPLPFKVRPTPEAETVRVGILPTVDIQGVPQFPLHFGAVTHTVLNPNLVQLTFSIDDEKNKIGELVLNLKATYRPVTDYHLSAF